MKRMQWKKSLSLIVCMVLIAATALLTTACNGNTKNAETSTSGTGAAQVESTVLGEGENQFAFTVTDAEGKESVFEIHTDKKIVGEALEELGLIAGDEGEFGLYVKTVNGLTFDYAKDGKYWAFYVDGAYASAGVDVTEIAEGAVYSFKVE